MDAKLLKILRMQRICFNPRARDGREYASGISVMSVSCFNPRARDGREGLFAEAIADLDVSIHAPVMDAKLFAA